MFGSSADIWWCTSKDDKSPVVQAISPTRKGVHAIWKLGHNRELQMGSWSRVWGADDNYNIHIDSMEAEKRRRNNRYYSETAHFQALATIAHSIQACPDAPDVASSSDSE